MVVRGCGWLWWWRGIDEILLVFPICAPFWQIVQQGLVFGARLWDSSWLVFVFSPSWVPNLQRNGTTGRFCPSRRRFGGSRRRFRGARGRRGGLGVGTRRAPDSVLLLSTRAGNFLRRSRVHDRVLQRSRRYRHGRPWRCRRRLATGR